MMKNGKCYNSMLSEAISKMGHGDIILIGDAGCAWPRHGQTKVIDLALCDGIPSVTDVLKVIMSELVVEGYMIPEEMKAQSPLQYQKYREILDREENKGNKLYEKVLPHTEFKDIWLNGGREKEQMNVFVRTGERCPYGYVALIAGVDF